MTNEKEGSMTERPPAGSSVEQRLTAIEDKLWPPRPRVRPGDIRVDVYRSDHAKPTVRVTHIPTGIVVTCDGVSRLEAKAECLARLDDMLTERSWLPNVSSR